MKSSTASGASVLYVLAVLLLLFPVLVFVLANDEGTAWLAVLLLAVCWPAGTIVGLLGDQQRRKFKQQQP